MGEKVSRLEMEKTRGLVAKFSDLVEFLKLKSDVANFFFGLRIFDDKSNFKSKPSSYKATVAFTKEKNAKMV